MKREEGSGDTLEDVDQAGASLEEIELVLTELKEAIAFGGALDDQLSHEANKLQIKLMKAKGRQISRVNSHGRPLSQAAFLATEIIVARQLARQLRALVPVAQLRLMGNADAASIALGVTVEETPSITVESTIASVSSSNLNVPLIVGIATSALVCVVLSAGACVVMHRRRRKVQQQREQQSLAYLVAGHDLAGQSNAERREASVSSLTSNKL